MPPTLFFDLSQINMNSVCFDRDAIAEINPQSYEMAQLDSIIWYDSEQHYIIGYKDITENEFWCRGHLPGRPIMPGVIMIESAAQLTSFYMRKIYGIEGFIGFAGIDYAKFRETVTPGSRLHLLGKITKLRSRQFTAEVQGVVDGKMVFEAGIKGMNV